MVVPDINPDAFPDNIPGGPRRRGRAAVVRPGLRPLDFDRFSRSRMPTIDDLPQISGDQSSVEGITGALQGIGMTFLSTVMNASPIFRAGLAMWAVGVLQGLLSSIETIEFNESNRNTPAGKMVQLLKSRIKSLIALIGPFAEVQKEFMKTDQRLSKTMNEIAKPAG